MTRSPLRTPRSWLRTAVGAATVLVAAAGASLALAPAANAAVACGVNYTVTAQWPGGFVAAVSVTNLGPRLDGWTLTWDYTAPNQTVTTAWGAVVTQVDDHVTITNPSWRPVLEAGARADFGFQGTWSISNPPPLGWQINGQTCSGPVYPTPSRSSTGPIDLPSGVSPSPGGASSSPVTSPSASR